MLDGEQNANVSFIWQEMVIPQTIQCLYVLLLDLWVALFSHCIGTNTSETQHLQPTDWMKPRLIERAALGSVKQATPS